VTVVTSVREFPYDDSLLDAIDTALPALNIHAKEGAPEEVVGMVLSSGNIVRLINQSRSNHMFTVSRVQLADKLAMIDPAVNTVIAIYHSHPGGTSTLSPTDVQAMKRTWTDDGLTLPWIVVVPDSRVAFWWLDPMYGEPRSHLIHMEV
jgi:proteasome lid subunit RPN8/RPN11